MSSSPIKWPGGKHYLVPRIVELMPPHTHYVEPYAGGMSVLLAKNPEGVSEVVNDTDGMLTNFWQVLRDDETYEKFIRYALNTPFSKHEFENACYVLNSVAQFKELGGYSNRAWLAWNFFVACRQSMMGMRESFAPLSKSRTRRGMNEQVSAWFGAIEGLPEAHARLRRVVIYNEEAIDVILREDSAHTLFYLDPPYLHDTRVSKELYQFEMTKGQHARLLKVLSRLKGKFMLSGYHSKMYDGFAKAFGWKCHEFELANHMGGGDKKRRMVECIWTNY